MKITNPAKKALSIAIILVMLASMVACGSKTEDVTSNEVSAPIVVAALNGPTGLGLAPMMDDERFAITVYQSPDEVTGKIINGEVDIAAIPSNLAAVLYNKTGGNIKIISPITLGVLYLVKDGDPIESFKDLEGETIYASGKGGVPEYVLAKLLADSNVNANITWLGTHGDVVSKLKSDSLAAAKDGTVSGTIALLPEPQVSIIQASSPEIIYNVFDINKLWTETIGDELPMGVLVAQKAFVTERSDDLGIFMANAAKSVDTVNKAPKEYSDGNEDTANLLVEKGFFKSAALAAKTIPNCNIVFYQDDSYKPMVESFFKILFDSNPKAVGGTIPDAEIYN